jgi:hypothetical protein
MAKKSTSAEHGIERDHVPSPWRELLDGPIKPFTFDLDRPDREPGVALHFQQHEAVSGT